MKDPQLAITNELNSDQRAAVLHEPGALCVLAGAGSGKTRVITHRMARHLFQGTPPEGLLALTFTNKAAGEMRERVLELCSLDRVNAENGPWVSTFHSFCARILRRHIHRIEPPDGTSARYRNSFTIYDTEDSRSLLKSILKELEAPAEILSAGEAIRLVSRMKNLGAEHSGEHSGTLAGGSALRLDFLTRAYEKYQQRLLQRNAVDFDDLLLLAVRLMRQHPKVLERYQEQFHEVLVDEYQDTNAIQYQLARLLTQQRGNLCITGDPDQSIYRWRGADTENWVAFERDYPDATTVKLERNYRSTERILAAANTLIVHNQFRAPKELWTKAGAGDRVVLRRYDDERCEAQAVAEQIMQLTAVGYRASDIAVFYRTNALSRSVEQELVSWRIPYEIVGGVEFFGRREVKDILAYLTVLVNPHEEESIRRAINTPRRGIGEKSVQRLVLAAHKAGMPLLDFATSDSAASEVRGKARRGLQEFTRLMGELRELADQSVAGSRDGVDGVERDGGVEGLIRHLVDATEYAEYLRRDFPGDSRDRCDNVEELIHAAREYDRAEHRQGRPPGLLGFLEEARLVSTVDGWDASADRVPLMTLHASKGLEFPVVLIIGLEQGLVPLIRPSEEADIEEERRLLYVGITRARERLFLSHAARRMRAGYERRSTPSQFLRELCSATDGGASAPGVGEDGKEGRSEGSYLDVDEYTRSSLKRLSTARFVEREYWDDSTSRGADSIADRRAGAGLDDLDGGEGDGSHYNYDYCESEDAFDYSQDEEPFPVGTRVYHDQYGEGRVELLSTAGRRVYVTVDFDCGTRKRFSLAHADLRSIPS